MSKIEQEGTEDTPYVLLDAEQNHFEISGRSLPEDVAEFYNPILEWVQSYKKDPNDTTELKIQLEYFNTASSKMIMDFLIEFEDLVESGHDVKVNWYYEEGDEDMEEAGEELGDLVEIPFTLQPVNEE